MKLYPCLVCDDVHESDWEYRDCEQMYWLHLMDVLIDVPEQRIEE